MQRVMRKLLEEEGLTVRLCEKELRKQGYAYSKTAIARYVKERNWKKREWPKIPDADVDEAVLGVVRMVGPAYGYRMLHSAVLDLGHELTELEVRQSLKRVTPGYVADRTLGISRQLNPQSYNAPYVGYNAHGDGNEKLAEFGVTVYALIDGHSDYIAAGCVMPKKNNLLIWDHMLKKEFNVCLFGQHKLRQLSQSFGARQPYRQTTSQKNNKIERIWGELNPKIGFPIKMAFIELERLTHISRNDATHFFAFSYVGCSFYQRALNNWMRHWNGHYCKGHGRPNSYLEGRLNAPADPSWLVSADTLAKEYERCISCGDGECGETRGTTNCVTYRAKQIASLVHYEMSASEAHYLLPKAEEKMKSLDSKYVEKNWELSPKW